MVYVYKDGTIAGMRLSAPIGAISIGLAERPKRKVSKEQVEKFLAAKAKSRSKTI